MKFSFNLCEFTWTVENCLYLYTPFPTIKQCTPFYYLRYFACRGGADWWLRSQRQEDQKFKASLGHTWRTGKMA